VSLGIRERNPAFRQQIFDVAEAQGESEIEPNRLLNDLRREPVPFVADFLHPLGYWTARGTASPKRRDNAERRLGCLIAVRTNPRSDARASKVMSVAHGVA